MTGKNQLELKEYECMNDKMNSDIQTSHGHGINKFAASFGLHTRVYICYLRLIFQLILKDCDE